MALLYISPFEHLAGAILSCVGVPTVLISWTVPTVLISWTVPTVLIFLDRPHSADFGPSPWC